MSFNSVPSFTAFYCIPFHINLHINIHPTPMVLVSSNFFLRRWYSLFSVHLLKKGRDKIWILVDDLLCHPSLFSTNRTNPYRAHHLNGIQLVCSVRPRVCICIQNVSASHQSRHVHNNKSKRI